MGDLPIIFSGPMVRALLAGTKTQTRRVLKPQPYDFQTDGCRYWNASGCVGGRICISDADLLRLHGWEPGQRRWVRETWATWMHAPSLPMGMGGRSSADPGEVAYKATDPEWDALMADRASLRELAAKMENGRTGNWVVRSPIHMPRAFSRLTLTVTEVRVQRLQDISEEDARAEGMACLTKDGGRTWKHGIADRDALPGTDDDGWPWSDWHVDPRRAYATLWNSLHGPDAWTANPWVAAISFSVTPANIDSLPEQAGGRA